MKIPKKSRTWGTIVAVAATGSLLVACTGPDGVPSDKNQPTVTATSSPRTAKPTPSTSPTADPSPTSTPKPAKKVPEGFQDGISVVEEAYGEEWANRLVADGDYLINLLYGGGLTDLVGAREGDEEFYWRVLEGKMTARALDLLISAVNDDERDNEHYLAIVTDRDGAFGEIDGKVRYLDTSRDDRPSVLLDFASEPAVGLKDGKQAYYVRDVDLTGFVEGGRLTASYRVMYLLLPGPDNQWIIDGWQREVLTATKFHEE